MTRIAVILALLACWALALFGIFYPFVLAFWQGEFAIAAIYSGGGSLAAFMLFWACCAVGARADDRQ